MTASTTAQANVNVHTEESKESPQTEPVFQDDVGKRRLDRIPEPGDVIEDVEFCGRRDGGWEGILPVIPADSCEEKGESSPLVRVVLRTIHYSPRMLRGDETALADARIQRPCGVVTGQEDGRLVTFMCFIVVLV
ncbi:MAG: hypothetical protein WD049_01105 [Candidatus Paceibacterota bacterium]